MDDKQKLEQFLSEQQFMVLAVTLADGTPWAVPVRIGKHEAGDFWWDSALETEHSKVISDSTPVAITIYQKTESIMFGFYAKGVATLVEEYKPGYGRYKFTVNECWINDETFVKREVSLG